MNIVRMVLGVITTYAHVWDLKQHSRNMARDHNSSWWVCSLYRAPSVSYLKKWGNFL